MSRSASAEIIDARSLVPFDYDVVLKSVRKTHRILLVTEASERGSFAMTLAANIGRFGFRDLEAAPRVLGSPNWIVPGAEMESTYFPQAGDIIPIVCFSLLFAFIATVYPSWRASRVRPAEALRYE